MLYAIIIIYLLIILSSFAFLVYDWRARTLINSLPQNTSIISPGDIITTVSSPTDLKKAIELSISGNFDTPFNHCLLALGNGQFISSERNPVPNIEGIYTAGIDVRSLRTYATIYPGSSYVLWKARRPLSQPEIDHVIQKYTGKGFADGYIRAAKAWLGISGCVLYDKKLCTEFIVEAVGFPSRRCAANTTLTALIEGMKEYAVDGPYIIVPSIRFF